MNTFQPDPETVSTQNVSNNELINELMKNTTTSNHVEVIETVISSLDQEQSAMVSHGDGSYLWKFKYGTVEVFVKLTGTTEEDTFTVWSTVLQLPVQNEAQLMRRLLEMNWSQTFEARFGIVDNQIIVLSARTVEDLSPSEISRAVTMVATLADNHDEALQAEFPAM